MTEPKIGCYTTICCLLDLRRLETEEEVLDVKAQIEDEIPVEVFESLSHAVSALRFGPLSPDEMTSLARFGWVEPGQ